MTAVIRCAIVGGGLLLLAAGFWFHAGKRLTSDLAAVWCLVGLAMVTVGAVPALSRWIDYISVWTGLALSCVCTVCLLGAFRICLMISKLVTQNQELAMIVSLLLAERRRNKELDRVHAGNGEGLCHEEDTVCY